MLSILQLAQTASGLTYQENKRNVDKQASFANNGTAVMKFGSIARKELTQL